MGLVQGFMEVTGMRDRLKFTISTIALALSSSVALAQEDETGFFAKADTTLAHDDNIYRVTDDLAQSDTYLSVAPELKLIGGFGKQRFELSYTGNYAKFADATDANFSDHDFKGKIKLDHTVKFNTRFEVGYQKEHEEPGAINRIQLNLAEYNKYEQKFWLAGIEYGQASAIGQISFNYRKTDKDYKNNNLDYLDFNSEQYTGRFTYRVAPKTRIYLEAAVTDFDYSTTQFAELDNRYKRYRAGVSWDFTNKLSGDFNIGYQDKNYLQESLRDISGLAYDGNVEWSVNSYTSVSVGARRESIDSSLEDTGGFLRNTVVLSASHDITELLSINLNTGYSVDELVFSSSREDERLSFNIGLDYEVFRYLKLGIFYSYEERDSTDPLADYKSNLVGINFTVSLDD